MKDIDQISELIRDYSESLSREESPAKKKTAKRFDMLGDLTSGIDEEELMSVLLKASARLKKEAVEAATVSSATPTSVTTDSPTWPVDARLLQCCQPAHIEKFSAFLAENAPTLVLTGPAKLTTTKVDCGYSIKAHIGGEAFSVIRVYQGKKKGPILVLRPREATAYIHAEVPLHQLASLFGVSAERAISRIAANFALPSVEQTELENNPDKYEDFGSW